MSDSTRVISASADAPKICMISFRNFFQEDRRAQKEAETLLARGYAVDVICSGREYGIPEERTARPRLSVTAIPVAARYDLPGRIAPVLNLVLYQARALPRFVRLALASRADAYHCHNVQSLPIGALASFFHGVPFFYDCRELWREIDVAGSGGSLGRIWGAIEKLYVRRARRVFAVCDFHADYLAGAYRIPRPTVVLNCPPRWEVPASSPLRERYGIPAGHTVAIHSGGLFEGVGIDRLIDAADHLDPGITIVVMGFFLRDAFKRQVEEAIRARRNVVLAQPVAPADVPAFLAGADVGVVLYLADYKANQSLPNKLFEYMMCGLAVVTNGYADTRAVVEDSQAGFALDPVTPATLAASLNRLHRDRALLEGLKKNARRAAVTRYCWEAEGEKVISAYEAASIGVPFANRVAPRPDA